MKKVSILLVSALLIASAAIGFFYYRGQKTTQGSGSLDAVSLKLNWLHQAEYAGNYVAADKGFYAAQGLKVNIIPFDFKQSVFDSVTSGQADFGTVGADELLLARERGVPVKAIAVIYKTNLAAMYALKKNKITKPQDFIGKTVGLETGSNTRYLYAAMMKGLGIDRSRIKEIPIGYDAKEVLDGSVDVATGYIINEPNLAKEAGQEVSTILMADYGINMYADVIFTTENLIKTNPGLVSRFLSATLKGWQYAIENESEAIDITLKYATDSTRIHQVNMLSDSVPLINDGTSPLGWMDQSQWEKAANLLLSQKILTKPINVNNAFTMQFLNEYYTSIKI
jgi:ABC-type nitrate/sulfonate/bicarbonate transport system substrate-binding protein